MAEPSVQSATARTAAAPLPGFPALSADQRAAVRDVLGAFFTSRLIVWVAGVGATLIFGFFPAKEAFFDPFHLTNPFGSDVGNLLVSPASRWDSAWYLGISHFGYGGSGQSAFFPLYPALMAIGGWLVGSQLVFGIFVSCVTSFGALYVLHRLVSLELDTPTARTTVWILAWLPPALILSAVYTEALYLFLSVSAFYSARTGRWPVAALLGALAAATRNSGILLMVPLAILYLYGPRTDRGPDRPALGFAPRFRVRADFLWLAAVPIGLIVYLVYLSATTGHASGVISAQQQWNRTVMPLGGIALGTWSGLQSLGSLILSIPGLNPLHWSMSTAGRRLIEFAFLVLALWLLRESWRRLPLAYTSLAALGLALPLSVPALDEPLKSLPRFTLVLFPLWIALAMWARERGRVRLVLAICGPLAALWTVLFTTWLWAP